MAGHPNQAWWLQKAQGYRDIGVQGPLPKQVWSYKGAGVQGERRMGYRGAGVKGCRGTGAHRHMHAKGGWVPQGGRCAAACSMGWGAAGAQGHKGVWVTGHRGEAVQGCVCTEMQHAAPQERKSVFFLKKPAHLIEK